jgi:hypothetical protein
MIDLVTAEPSEFSDPLKQFRKKVRDEERIRKD